MSEFNTLSDGFALGSVRLLARNHPATTPFCLSVDDISSFLASDLPFLTQAEIEALLVVTHDHEEFLTQAEIEALPVVTHDHEEFLTQAEIEALPGFGGSGGSVMIGEIKLWPLSYAPVGWLLCDGSEVLRSSALGSLLGNIYGDGDGITTCNIPDLRGRVGVGAGQGAGLTGRTVGEIIGEEAHSLSEDENGQHAHRIPMRSTSQANNNIASAKGGDPENYTDFYSESSGLGSPHNTIQPSLVLSYIIYKGV